MSKHSVGVVGPVGRPVHARAVSGASSSRARTWPALRLSHPRNQSRASNARMVTRVFPGATTGRWLARPPCHCVSRQREGGRCKAGDTFAHVTCDDRGWPGIARDDHGARTCVVAWVTAARGARAEGTSACHWWGGRSDGHTTGDVCLARSCYSLPTHHATNRTLACEVCDEGIRSRAHRPKRANAWRAARSGSWLRLH